MAGFSLQDEASLIMTPNFITSDTLVSIKPEDDSGNFAFSRGTDITATRVNSSGFIEKGYENLLLQSNQFDTTWYGSPSNRSITSGFSGYDGTNDAWKLEAISDNNYSVVSQAISNAGVETFSVYAKAGTSNFFRIQITGGTNTSASFFDLSGSGAVGNNFNNIDAKIESVGNGWFRFSVTANKTTSSTCVIMVVDADGSANVTTGANIYIQDAQLEQSLAATEYIESGATTGTAGILENQPRLDYSGGATCPSVLLEPSRSNTAPYSEYLAPIGYIYGNISPTYNNAISPEGVNNVTLFEATGSAPRFKYNVSGTPAGYNTYSIFAKAGTSSYLKIRVYDGSTDHDAVFDLTDGSFSGLTSGVVAFGDDYGNGWYRVAISYNQTNAGTAITQLYISDTLVGSVYLYGLQFEKTASYPSSYIPTYGASATRTGDVATSTTSIASTGSLSISLGKQQEPYFTLLEESFQAAALVNNIAIAYSPTALKVSLNGAIVVNATGTYDTSSLSSLQLGHLNGADQMGGGVKDLIMFNDFLSDTELNALTV